MTYLLAVAVLAGAPHAPAAYHAVERPVLLARLQGEWVWHKILEYTPNTQGFQGWPLLTVLEQRLVFSGSRYRHAGLYPVRLTIDPKGYEALIQIQDISATHIRAYGVLWRGEPDLAQNRFTIPYSVRGDTLEYNGALFVRVPLSRPGRPWPQGNP
jgi:hypothetical protein